MVITVLVIWLALSLPVAVFVAALCRAGQREDEARDRLPTAPPEPADSPLSGSGEVATSSGRRHG